MSTSSSSPTPEICPSSLGLPLPPRGRAVLADVELSAPRKLPRPGGVWPAAPGRYQRGLVVQPTSATSRPGAWTTPVPPRHRMAGSNAVRAHAQRAGPAVGRTLVGGAGERTSRPTGRSVVVPTALRPHHGRPGADRTVGGAAPVGRGRLTLPNPRLTAGGVSDSRRRLLAGGVAERLKAASLEKPPTGAGPWCLESSASPASSPMRLEPQPSRSNGARSLITCSGQKPYRGFESLRLRHRAICRGS